MTHPELSDSFYEAVFAYAADGIEVLDMQGHILACNPAYQNLLGYPASDILGQHTTYFFHPDSRAGFELALALMRQTGQAESEVHLQPADGRWCVVWRKAQLRRDASGAPVGIVVYSRDITTRQQAEAQLRRQAERNALISTISNRLVSVLDPNLEIQGSLKQLGEFLQADRAYIFLSSADGTHMSNTHEWCAPGIVARRPELQNLPTTDFQHVVHAVQNRQHYNVPRVADLPADAPERHEFEREGIQSLVCLPLYEYETVVGFMGFDAVRQPRDWGTDDLTSLNLVGELFGNVLERDRVERVLRQRSTELETVARVSTAAATVLDPQTLLQQVSDLTKQAFNLYHAHIYVLNQAGDQLVLTAGAGEVGRTMLAEGHHIPLLSERSLVARAARTRQGVIRNDARRDPDFLPHPLLPETHSEMAVPIIVGDTLLGVFDVQADIANRFSDDDVRIQTTLAVQVAVALQNAQRYQDVQAALAQAENAQKELQAFNRRLVREGWQDHLETLSTESQLNYTVGDAAHLFSAETLTQPLAVQGEAIGALHLSEPGVEAGIAQELLTAVAERLSTHIENLRLNERTETALAESRGLTAELRRLASVQAALSQAATEADILAALMGALPNVTEASAQLIYVNQVSTDEGASAIRVAGWSDSQVWLVGHPQLGGPLEAAYTQLFTLLSRHPNEVVISPDVLNDPHFAEEWRTPVHYLQARAVVFMPLLASGQWQGMWICAWPHPLALGTEDHSVLQRLVGPTSAVVASRRAALAQRATLQDLAARDRLLAESATTANDLLRLGVSGFAEAFGRMGQALRLSRLYIFENFEDGDGLLNARQSNEWCAPDITPHLSRPEWQNVSYDLTVPHWREQLAAGHTVYGLVNDLSRVERDMLEPLGVRAFALLPLFVESRFFGFLGADDCLAERAWSEFELEILQALSVTLSNTIANSLLIEQTRKRAEEMASVAELGSLAASIVDVERMIDAVTRRAQANLGYYRVETYLLNDVAQDLALVAWAGVEAHEPPPPSLPLHDGGFLVTRAARIQQTQVANNLLADFDLRPVAHLLEARAQVAVPLVLGERVIGVFTTYGDRVDAFTPGDINILTTLATQLTVAIENARSLQRTEATLRDLDRLTRQLTREGWQEFTQTTPETLALAYDLLTVRSADATTLSAGLTQALAVRGETIGEIVLDYTPTTEDDSTELLSAVAEQLSAHLENLRLTQQTQRALANTQQLYDLTARISAAASLEEVLATAASLKNAASGVLFEYIVEDGLDELRVKSLWRSQIHAESLQLMREGGAFNLNQFPAASAWVSASEPVLYGDTWNDPRIDTRSRLFNQALGVRAAIVLPLNVGNQSVGILLLAWFEPQNFTAEDEQRYVLLSKQAAVVVNNRLLLQQTERRAAELAVLNDISRNIAGVLDREQILLNLQEQLARIMPVESFFAGLYDADKDMLYFPFHYEDGRYHPADDGPAASFPASYTVLQERQPRRTLRTASDLERITQERLREGNTSRPSGSMLFAPLMVGARSIGVLSVQAYSLNAYTSEHLNLLMGVANQAAIALENASLFEQTQRRAAQLATVARVSTAASTVLDAAQLLQDVVDLTKTQFSLYHAHIYLLDASGVALQLAAGAGEVGRQMAEMGRQIPVEAERSIVARAAYQRKPVLVNNTRQSRDFLPHPLLPETRAELAVPLVVADELLGVLDVQANRENAFDDDDVRIQSTLAAQVAVALRNAQSYAEQLATVARLKELDELKSSFLANMSHELRTPLNSILGFTDVILEGLDGPLTDRMENDLRIVQKNGRHLLELINDVLDMAKIEAGRMTLGIEPFELPEVLEDVMDTALGLAHEKSLELRLELDPGTSYHIEADRVRTRQVLYNLVSNAIKYTERGHVTLRAVRYDDMIRLTVEDTGLGIPQEKLKSIFEAFSQVDNSTTRKVGGTGLGLPITRHLIELHGGRLWVESEMGKGSKFHVELPALSHYRPPED